MRNTRRIAIMVLAIQIGVLACCSTVRADPAGTKKYIELVAQEERIKREFDKLKAEMLKLADELKKVKPESAMMLRKALNEAQKRFIAEGMQNVAEHLTKGDAAKALRAKKIIVVELREVLKTLRFGTIEKKNKADRKKKKEDLKKIKDIIGIQKELIEQSGHDMNKGSLGAQVAEAQGKMREAITRQKKAKSKTGKLEKVNPEMLKLIKLREEVRKLIEKQSKINIDTPKTPIGKLGLAADGQNTLAGETAKVKKLCLEIGKDPRLKAYLAKRKSDPKMFVEAAKSLKLAGGEMKKASSALKKSSVSKARSPQIQALIDLKKADMILSGSLAGRDAEKLAGKQDKLAKDVKELSDKIKDIVKKSGEKSKAGDMSKTVKQMGKASKKLAGQKPKSAEGNQKKALDELEKKRKELDKLADQIKKKANPSKKDQAKRQKKLADQVKAASKDMKKSDDNKECQKCMGKAAKSMKKAAESLKKDDSAKANEEQKKALKELEKLRDELEEEIEKDKEEEQEKKLAKISEMLAEILKKQQPASAETKKTFKLRKTDGYERSEILVLNRLSNTEGKLAEEIGNILKMLDKEDKAVVFPIILRGIQKDLEDVQNRLAQKRAGTSTQDVQKEIEQSLEELLDTFKKLTEYIKKQKAKKGGSGSGKPKPKGPPDLVPPIAELKMLRTMQKSINRRTARIVSKKAAGEINAEDFTKEHKLLAGREGKVRSMMQKMVQKMKKQADQQKKMQDKIRKEMEKAMRGG